MAKELIKTESVENQPVLPIENAEDTARVLILGGLEADAGVYSASEALLGQMQAQDLRIGALHQSDASAVVWLMEAGVTLLSMTAMRNESKDASAIGVIGATTIGAGETEAMANRPHVCCINGIRLGVVSFAEQKAGAFSGRADILSLQAVDRVRMLLCQCDHVIVLVRSGLPSAELPLPEWRARYRHFLDAGASIVVDTGAAKGWEAHKNGLAFYGLGSPAGSDSLGLFLTLHRNGKFTYEARALQNAGQLDFSKNDAFRAKIDAQNKLFWNEEAYFAAVNDMCTRVYCQSEAAQKRGVLGLFSPQAEEEMRLLSLLENESLRLTTQRAIRLKRGAEKTKRENAKKT